MPSTGAGGFGQCMHLETKGVWLGATPAEVVGATLNLDRDTLAALRKDKPLITE